jgi:hypothetical protein
VTVVGKVGFHAGTQIQFLQGVHGRVTVVKPGSIRRQRHETQCFKGSTTKLSVVVQIL